MIVVSYTRVAPVAPNRLYISVLHASYRTYRRETFVDTLNDWGWYGAPSEVPYWYSGTSWT